MDGQTNPNVNPVPTSAVDPNAPVVPTAVDPNAPVVPASEVPGEVSSEVPAGAPEEEQPAEAPVAPAV